MYMEIHRLQVETIVMGHGAGSLSGRLRPARRTARRTRHRSRFL